MATPPQDDLSPRNVLSMFFEELHNNAKKVAEHFGLTEEETPQAQAKLTAEELAYYREAVGTEKARDRMLELVLRASQDGVITAAEIEKIHTVQQLLQISDGELSAIKLSVLHNVVGQLTLAGLVRPEDMRLLHELTRGLAFRPEDRPQLEAMLNRLKDLQ